ncbi:MAG: HAD family hydrolase [Gammaproteobacteria bacterium]|nr:HAD family hydrolase [Gammaproteobacteria bacterium]
MTGKAKALILDRDGVVNLDKDYVYRIEDFEFIDGVFDLCRDAAAQGYLILIITNQSGIGRGYYTEEDFHVLTGWMKARFEEEGVTVAQVYFCPHHPVHGIGKYKQDSYDRKPNPGMILKAAQDFDLDLSNCILVGDRESDMKAARTAGVGHTVLYRPEEEPDIQTRADYVISDLGTVLELVTD